MTLMQYVVSAPIACGISALALFVTALLVRQGGGRRWLLALSLLLYVRYMVWRVVYTIPTGDAASFVVGSIVYLAELYGLVQFCFYTYQSWSPKDRRSEPLTHYPTVDIMVTVVDEPLAILRQTLVGSLAQDYPRDRFTVHVLDDGHRDEAKALAASLGCNYIRRHDRPTHAKAGNLNHALRQTRGDIVAVFDVDHVPARTFLKETVGFFNDPKVAMVQTPHHFYNPDVFQRNLQVGERITNEQALFFRSLQAGRDAHNSAFFAGSGGLFRRAPLMEIGGFQTQTITEDIHTSMNLHARGYRSCYLNRVLSAGLMPETFEGYLKQRKRWAMGCIQMLIKDNPLLKSGLTVSQRLDYFGSVFYFFFGLPRLICLLAPLYALLLDIPPLKANVWELTNYFMSFFIASALIMRPISGGSRNPFWSDVYETAMCFALSAVAIKALTAPRKERPFEVTPKGQTVRQSTATLITYAWPHLIAFGLLVCGLAFGGMRWWDGSTDPGLPVSLWWGSINLLLLTVALFVASEQSQARQNFRLTRNYRGTLLVGAHQHNAKIVNISEHGAGVLLAQPILAMHPYATLAVHDARGEVVHVDGRIVRQDRLPSGETRAGIEFMKVDNDLRHQLIETMFGNPDDWERHRAEWADSGVSNSLRSLGMALAAPWKRITTEKRRIPRLESEMPCRLRTRTSLYHGEVKDISYSGISAVLQVSQQMLLKGKLELPGVTLEVMPVSIVPMGEKSLVRFHVDSIVRGEAQWRDAHLSSWQQAS